MTVHKFKEKDFALLVDRKGRQLLIQLEEGGEFHTHTGIVLHNEIIGKPAGSQIASTKGGTFRVFTPGLSDYIHKMPRGAQIIYPKDLGHILFWADIYPGVKVFESGVGSGALSLALLRAGAKVVGYEIKPDHIQRARKNVTAFLGEEIASENYEIHQKDSRLGISEEDFDRVILDLPEPWEVIPHIIQSLLPGGTMLAYTPSITQAVSLQKAISENQNHFALPETLEILHRSWYIADQAVRPEHRMVAHTGFLTRALKLAPSDIAAA